MSKKYLLGDLCPCCEGLGVVPATDSSYRARIKFPEEEWEFLENRFDSLEKAEYYLVSLWAGDPLVRYQIVSPDGELFDIMDDEVEEEVIPLTTKKSLELSFEDGSIDVVVS